ncbi:MAG: YqgE/AlgH family protein [Rhodobacteraceae bacterium]|nr:YqgE/AlgH family protein [Paracoccaceae bacterium]
MSIQSDSSDLTGQLLIAMPGMNDPYFEMAVIFLCTHSERGAHGLIVNKVIRDLSFADILEQLDIEGDDAPPDLPVCFGGPVEKGRGFILHSSEYAVGQRDTENDRTQRVDDRFSISIKVNVLRDMVAGRGPKQVLVGLGYTGWGPGQLEAEIRRNNWLTCPASSTLVFGHRMDGKWEAALASLGIDPLVLSPDAGHA